MGNNIRIIFVVYYLIKIKLKILWVIYKTNKFQVSLEQQILKDIQKEKKKIYYEHYLSNPTDYRKEHFIIN